MRYQEGEYYLTSTTTKHQTFLLSSEIFSASTECTGKNKEYSCVPQDDLKNTGDPLT